MEINGLAVVRSKNLLTFAATPQFQNLILAPLLQLSQFEGIISHRSKYIIFNVFFLKSSISIQEWKKYLTADENRSQQHFIKHAPHFADQTLWKKQMKWVEKLYGTGILYLFKESVILHSTLVLGWNTFQ